MTVYLGEVFVDAFGAYIGDFSGGYGYEPTMPLGWAHGCTGTVTGFTGGFGMFSMPYWDDCSDPTTQPVAVFETILLFFPVSGPTFLGTIVVDNSGPHPFESHNACRIEFAGSPGSFSWVGPAASLVPGASAYAGGWTPIHGDEWTFSGWFRAVPDSNGFICSGFECGLGYAQYGDAPVTAGTFTVTEAWQYVEIHFTWPYATGAPGIPCIQAVDSRFNNPVTKTVSIPPFGGTFTITKDDLLGAIEVKEAHLYLKRQEGPYHVAQHF